MIIRERVSINDKDHIRTIDSAGHLVRGRTASFAETVDKQARNGTSVKTYAVAFKEVEGDTNALVEQNG